MGQPRIVKNGVPVVELLAAKLRRQLDDQRFQPGEFVASEYELARREHVNRMVARRAVDGLVREGKLERRPGKGLYVAGSGVAGNGKATVPRMVQIVLPTLGFFWTEAAHGIKQVAVSVGVRTQIHDARGSFDQDLEAVRTLPESHAQGAIIGSLHHPRFTEALYELKRANYPFVLVDEALRDNTVPTVIADNLRGDRMVAKALLRRGHRRIGLVGFSAASRPHLEGLRAALAEADIAIPERLIGRLKIGLMEGGDWSAEVARVTRELLEQPDRPTAMFYCNDVVASLAYPVIRDLGLRIPDDVSVVGFGGNPICRLIAPTLTTVREPAREMGATAMEMLLELMNGKSSTGICPGPAIPMNRDSAVTSERQAPEPADEHGCADAPRPAETSCADGKSETRDQKPTEHNDALHRILPVTWQDGDSIGPAPGDFAARTEQVTGEQEITRRRDEYDKPPSGCVQSQENELVMSR